MKKSVRFGTPSELIRGDGHFASMVEDTGDADELRAVAFRMESQTTASIKGDAENDSTGGMNTGTPNRSCLVS